MAEHARPLADVATGDGALLSVTIVTPHGARAEYYVRHLRAPGVEGDFGVLPGHIPFITSLRAGALILDTVKETKVWAVSGGFAEVLSNRVTILAETAEPSEAIDRERAQSARQRAIERLRDRENLPNLDIQRANAALARALIRIQISSGDGPT